MKATQADPLLRDIHLLFRAGATGALTDGELLERFVADRDEAAFEVLVHRLGPMVLGVCRRMLRDRHDAEDAFQATFLVLARRAAAIAPPARVGPWLYGVARHVASRSRATIARRRSRETTATAPDRADDPREDRDDLLSLLDGELGRLPEKYRAPIVLCHLEGKPYKEAARQLGLREGTLSGRLTRGRALLAARLSRRGAAMSAGMLSILLTKEASARVPMSLAASGAGVAAGFCSGVPAAVAISAEVAALTNTTLRTMLMTKLRVTSLVLATVGMVGVGVAAGGRDEPRSAEGAAREPKTSESILLRWPGGPVDVSRFAYEVIDANAPKSGTGNRTAWVDGPGSLTVAGPMKPVEAYKIGDDLYINVAPPGSGRVLLEKVMSRASAGGQGAASNNEAPALAKDADPKSPRTNAQFTTRAAPDGPKTAQPPAQGSSRSVAGMEPKNVTFIERREATTPPQALLGKESDLDDATFVRRVYLDILGRTPTRDEVEAFARDDSAQRRAKLVGRLVDDPAFVEHAKASIKARLAPPKPAAKPVRFKIEGAVLDRVDVENGNQIDVRLDNGGNYTPTDRASDHAILALRDGQLMTTIMPPATRIQAIPVAVDASIEIETGGGTITTGVGESILKALKPGMRLALDLSAEGLCLFVRGIKAKAATPTEDTSKPVFFNFEVGRTR